MTTPWAATVPGIAAGGMAAIVVKLLAVPATGFAQANEIQVYDGSLAPPGVVNLTLHDNTGAEGFSAACAECQMTR